MTSKISGQAKIYPTLAAYEVAAAAAPPELSEEIRHDLSVLLGALGRSAARDRSEGLAGLNTRFATFDSSDGPVPDSSTLWRIARRWAAISPATMPAVVARLAAVEPLAQPDPEFPQLGDDPVTPQTEIVYEWASYGHQD